MKKSIIFLCFLMMFGFTYLPLTAAQQIPNGMNYLSLSNLRLRSDYSYLADTIEPIEINPNQTYTLVLSYGFIGQNIQAIDMIEIEIEDQISQASQTVSFVDDWANERVYIEFNVPYTLIYLYGIPMNPSSYDSILYEGPYMAFDRFEPYVGQTIIFDHYGILVMNVDQLWESASIDSLITAQSPYADVIACTVIDNEYDQATALPGVYRRTYEVIYADIITHYYLDIHIYDVTAPVILLEEAIEVPLTEKMDVSSILNYLVITDNVTSLSQTDLSIIEDTYTQANTVGNYYIKVSVDDAASNQTIFTIPILIYDLNGPDVTFPSDMFIYTSDQPLTQQSILDRINVYDDVDGDNVTVTWVIDEYQQTQLPGIYKIRLTYQDTSLNETTINLQIHVIENQGPTFHLDPYVIDTSTHQAMTIDDIIDWFYQHTQTQGLNVSHVNVLYNEYESHTSDQGEYYVYLSYQYEDQIYTTRILMRVDENPTQDWIYYIGITLIILIGGGFVIYKKKKR